MFLLQTLTICSNKRLVGFVSIATGTRCRPRNNGRGHACRFALLVNFVDFDGCNVLKEEKGYVYFFLDKIAEEFGDLIRAYKFGADFAGDAPQRTPNDGAFECSVFPTVIKKPIKRRQLVGVGVEALRKVDPLAIGICKAFQRVGNGEKWPRKYLGTIGNLRRS